MAGDRHERALEAPAHVLDEARLPAAGGALQHHRKACQVGRLEELDLVAQGQVVGLLAETEILDALALDRHSCSLYRLAESDPRSVPKDLPPTTDRSPLSPR